MLLDKIYQLSLSWVSLSRLYIHNRILYSVKTKVKIPKCIFRILAGRQRWGLAGTGIVDSLVLTFPFQQQGLHTTGWLRVVWHLPGKCSLMWHPPEPSPPLRPPCLTWACVCVNYVTVSSETQKLFDVWIFLSWISQKQFIDALKSLSCNLFYSFVYSLVRYFKILWFFCNF